MFNIREAHDNAMEQVRLYWRRKYGTEGKLADELYIELSNGDIILCDEAQDVFNQFYNLELYEQN